MGRLLVCVLWVLLLAGPALAIPETYNFTTGTVTVTASTDPGGTVILDTTVLPLSGVFVEFDANTIDLSDLFLTIPMSGLIAMTNPYGGFDQFVIESADISPGLGYSTLLGAPGVNPGEFSFLAGPLDINGVYSASDSNNVNPPVMNIPVPFTDSSLISGSININTGTLVLTGITLAEIPAFPGESDALSIKADIVFTGVVPEPNTAALLALGLVGLACKSRRNFLN